MSDFVAQIRATLDTKQAQSDFNSFKSKIESEIINLKVKFDGTGNNSSFDTYLNNIQKQAQTAGKGIGTSLQQGIKSVKFNGNNEDFIKQYLEQIKKDTKEAESVAKKFDVSQKDALKAVNARNGAEIKANNEAIKEQKRQQQEQQKLNAQNLAQIRTAEESQKRIQVQQQIAAMKANAVQKNAHYNSLVQQGKDNIIKWEQQYKEQNNYAEKLEAAQKRIVTLQTNSKADSFKGMYGDTAKYKDIENNLSKIEQLQSRINSEMAKGSSKDTSKINADLKEMTSLLSKSENAFNNLTKPIGALDASIASNKTLSWLKENSKAAKELGSAFEELAERQKHATTQGELDNYNKQYRDLVSTAQAKGLTGKSAFDEFKRAATQIAEFTGMYGILQNVMQDLPREMVQAVSDINKAQIELTKVSNAPTAQLNKYWDEATESAKKYGATIDDVISSTADWSRLGYNLDDAKKLSDATTLLQKVGDNMTQQSSSQGLISTLKGFNMQADEVGKIVDVANQIANTQPIDSSGIFEGLERSASSMKAANNTFEQTVSLITAANSVVQDPSSIGTALKTISMRVRGADTELQQAGLDTEGMAESVAKLREEIVALSGVDIMKDENTFKSTYDILDELSKKWSDLTDIQQASVTELIAGKRNGNIVSALMSNFDIARESLNTALNESTGSAERELENWNQGLEASFNRFKAQFQELSTTSLSSDFLKGFVDAGTGALDILTQIIDKFGLLTTVITGVGITKTIMSIA